MAYKIIRAKSNTYTSGREITAVLDTADDLYSLQVNESGMSPGSIAIVADAGLTSYVLNASGEWKSTDEDDSSGGGGANPNVVETYTGTVADIFESNEIDGYSLAVELSNFKNATAVLGIDASSLNFGIIAVPCTSVDFTSAESDTKLSFSVAGLSTSYAVTLAYVTDVTTQDAEPNPYPLLAQAQMLTPATEGQIVDARDTVRDLPATLTIIRHPLTGTLEAAEGRTY